MARRFQYSLRDIFRWTLYVCLAIGTWMAYARLVGNAQRDAIEKAILAGSPKAGGPLVMPRPQFSLKSLFVAMTLAAVGCVVGASIYQALLALVPQPARSGLRQIGISLASYAALNAQPVGTLPEARAD